MITPNIRSYYRKKRIIMILIKQTTNIFPYNFTSNDLAIYGYVTKVAGKK